MENRHDDKAIIAMLETAAFKYANGEVEEVVQDDGAKIGVVKDGSYSMTDVYHSNEAIAEQPDGTYDAHFLGRTVISRGDCPLWIVNYDTNITDKDALDFYYEGVMANPNPDLPIFGIQGLKNEAGNLEYNIEPLHGTRLVLARFAILEMMYDYNAGKNVYLGHSSGGWLT